MAIVGTGKNVGKTVAMRALYEAAIERGVRVGLVSAGRDGEALDVIEHHRKPRLWLYPDTWLVTTPEMISQGGESVKLERISTACGPLRRARVSKAAFYELIGPPTASGVRTAIEALQERCDLVLVDGAIDRLATISTGEDAVIVACGAAAAASEEEAVEDARALVARLSIPRVDGGDPFLRIEGALMPELADRLIASKEQRQIVVHSPAFVMMTGKTLARSLAQLRLRCEHPVSVVAVTVASIGSRRHFEPRHFLEAVGAVTGLPTYDVYAGAAAGRGTIRSLVERPESEEFIVMRSDLSGDVPAGIRVLREEPTYLLCERSE